MIHPRRPNATQHALNERDGRFRSVLGGHFAFARQNPRIETTKNVTDFDVLIIDNIGVLMHLYQYAKLAYVGGAFGKGLHNILEPASFKVPVIFGANHSKFPEAYQFINAGIGFSVNSKAEFDFTFDKLINDNLSDKVNSFMISQVGATHKIISKIF